MTKTIIMLVALILVAAMVLVACGKPIDNKGEDSSDLNDESDVPADSDQTPADSEQTPADSEQVTDPVVDESPYTVTENLMKNISAELYDAFSNNRKALFSFPKADEAPYVMGNVTEMNDCRILSVKFPVWKTATIDSDGNFIFTLYVFNSSFAGLKQSVKRSYEIKVNAAEHGLSANKSNVRKVINVDLSSYDITLEKNETIGYYSENDTIFAAMLLNQTGWNNIVNTNPAFQIVREKAPELAGCYRKVGTANVEYTPDTLMLDFEWEKTYEKKSEYLAMNSTEEYDSMIASLLEKYKGKYLSVMGDSISTFRGVCNDGSANAAIKNNEPYYPDFNGNVCDYTLTYWGKVIKDLQMKTGVINSWSGSQAYGRWDDIGKNMLVRSSELHRDNGTPNNPADDIAPDVIIIYMGINDLNGGVEYDRDLAKIIANGASKAEIDSWLADVVKQAERTGDTIVKGKTYKNFDQVYALSLKNIKEKYPNAEIICMTFQETNKGTALARIEAYNNTVKTLAEYFGAIVVDQSTDIITSENCHAYAGDMSSLHPTAAGHAIAAENIIKCMYENSKN